MSFTTLVEAGILAEHSGDSDWVVFDVRHQLADVGFGERAYAAGHIPGAWFLHCDRDLSGVTTGRNGRHPLPDPTVLVHRLAACGVGPETQVVVYDDSQGMIAGRLWWLLRWLGHSQVAVLDGGIAAWQAAGRALTTAQPVAKPVSASLGGSLAEFHVDAGMVEARIGQAGTLLVDARSPDRFRGENETIDPVGGHIPGAANRFFRDNLAADGRFKQAGQLREEWNALLGGISPREIVHQCGSGVSACHNILAMEIAGLGGSRLYPGSWSEWCADQRRPVAR